MLIDIEFTEQKADPEIDENAIDFRRLDVQEVDNKNIAKDNLLRVYESKLIKKFSQKSN